MHSPPPYLRLPVVMSSDKPEPKPKPKPTSGIKPIFPRPPARPPVSGVIGGIPEGQPWPPWTGVYPPGTIQNRSPINPLAMLLNLGRM